MKKILLIIGVVIGMVFLISVSSVQADYYYSETIDYIFSIPFYATEDFPDSEIPIIDYFYPPDSDRIGWGRVKVISTWPGDSGFVWEYIRDKEPTVGPSFSSGQEVLRWYMERLVVDKPYEIGFYPSQQTHDGATDKISEATYTYLGNDRPPRVGYDYFELFAKFEHIPTSGIPEPATMLMGLLGLAGFVVKRFMKS